MREQSAHFLFLVCIPYAVDQHPILFFLLLFRELELGRFGAAERIARLDKPLIHFGREYSCLGLGNGHSLFENFFACHKIFDCHFITRGACCIAPIERHFTLCRDGVVLGFQECGFARFSNAARRRRSSGCGRQRRSARRVRARGCVGAGGRIRLGWRVGAGWCIRARGRVRPRWR